MRGSHRFYRTVRVLGVLAVLAGLIVGLALAPAVASAATPQQIEDAIENGITWLVAQQQADGRWLGSYPLSSTGLAVLKLETHAAFMGMSPYDPAFPYSANVAAGLTYILNNCYYIDIGLQDGNDPDTNGNGKGVRAYSLANSSHEMYEVGISLMAISASQSADRIVAAGSQAGRRFDEVAQDMVDFIAWAQYDAANAHEGGWRYAPNYSSSDNSISGYVALGLHYATSSFPWGFGLTVPAWVYSQLNTFINSIQDPVNGDTGDGGSHYTPSGGWINILKTGNLLAQMAMVGDGQAAPRVINAVDYMERHWDDANTDPGWRNHYQACFTTMKGFQALGIETITVMRGGSPVTVDWYDEMSTMIVSTQNANGSWPIDPWADSVLSTCWALLTLEKAAPPAMELNPAFDINPVNTTHTVTAVYKRAGEPQVGVLVNFDIISGPNAGLFSGFGVTDANGEVSWSYQPDNGTAGKDVIRATAVDESGAPLVSVTAEKVWEIPEEVPGLSGWGIALAVFGLGVAGLFVMQRRNVLSH